MRKGQRLTLKQRRRLAKSAREAYRRRRQNGTAPLDELGCAILNAIDDLELEGRPLDPMRIAAAAYRRFAGFRRRPSRDDVIAATVHILKARGTRPPDSSVADDPVGRARDGSGSIF